MTRLSLERLSRLDDFGAAEELRGLLTPDGSGGRWRDVRVSPDGQHVHVILHEPSAALATFDRVGAQAVRREMRAAPAVSGAAPLADLLYLESGGGSGALLAVVFRNGGAQFWRYWEQQARWHLLHTGELCNSPSAKVVSVCASARTLVWCEERPPSEGSSLSSSTSGISQSQLRHCVCSRPYEVRENGVSLGGVHMALHNNPPYTVCASGDSLYLVPDARDGAPSSTSKLLLTWSPQRDALAVNTGCGGALLRHDLTRSRESDFRKLISSCVGMLLTMQPPEILAFCPAPSGGLLLLLESGWLSWLCVEGTMRHIYKLADNCLADRGASLSLNIFGNVVALAVDRTLFLIDTTCGLELEKITLDSEGVLFVNCQDPEVPHLLCEQGVFLVKPRQPKPECKVRSHPESLRPGSILMEAVFEEACRYYQQRSLSSTQLTVEKLKSGGMFQAPITLSSILRDYLNGQKGKDIVQSNVCHGKLLTALEADLKILLALEDTKLLMLRASEKELAGYCESLIHEEVRRLLCSEMERDNVLYLNLIFSTFPSESWQAVQKVLQLRCNGEGSISTEASPEVWKTVLNPVQAVAHSPLSSGQHPQATAPANVAVPVFELICSSVFRFQPCWLPQFLELAQQQAGRSYGMPESPESLPLYRRALAALPKGEEHQDLEVELLLCSQRPHAVMQALRILMGRQEWQQVIQVAERFCQQSPLLNKEIFTTLLCEVSQHRELDPYLDLLWALCPEDLSVTSILNIVLKNLPPTCPSSRPFETSSAQLTVGLLRPLLSRVLLRETKPSHTYTDILHSPTFPPLTPPRQPKGLPRTTTDPAVSHPNPTERNEVASAVSSSSSSYEL
ncbi:Hermansky-Pudlak syndrome 6 protein-like [Scleropages formosus]|uniref:HPS6 biosis of lysosomal organelles complex 2 subunit 3 n=1 Tax=Scleropages formosus TaxID=113540 RepID=A0A0P7UIV3_SCLFO|nr:Hermansky-Pudlak syndrome 6 protein-like [Scleropages formosus]KPP59092.1 Hermansky-Pudlak syndrome 6 protein-like [Scleropages formosus]